MKGFNLSNLTKEKSGKFESIRNESIRSESIRTESIKTVPVTETVIRLVRLDPTPFSAEHSYLDESCLLIGLKEISSDFDTIILD